MAASPLTICLRAGPNALPTRAVLTSYSRVPNASVPIGDQRISANRPAVLTCFRDRDGTTGALVGTVSVWGANLPNPDMGSTTSAVFKGDGVATNYDSTIPYAAFLNYNWIPIIFRGDLVAKTGTVAVTAGGRALAGSSTLFTTEFYVGATIRFNGESHVIAEITSDTAATIADPIVATGTGLTLTGSTHPVQLLTTDFTIADNAGSARLTLAAAAQAPLGARVELHFVTPRQVLADGAHPYEKIGITAYSAMWALFGASATNSKTTITLEGAGH